MAVGGCTAATPDAAAQAAFACLGQTLLLATWFSRSSSVCHSEWYGCVGRIGDLLDGSKAKKHAATLSVQHQSQVRSLMGCSQHLCLQMLHRSRRHIARQLRGLERPATCSCGMQLAADLIVSYSHSTLHGCRLLRQVAEQGQGREGSMTGSHSIELADVTLSLNHRTPWLLLYRSLRHVVGQLQGREGPDNRLVQHQVRMTTRPAPRPCSSTR